MTVLVIIKTDDEDAAYALGRFIADARALDESRYRRPRAIWRRLLDAFKPDRSLWTGEHADEWNHVPGIAFRYEVAGEPSRRDVEVNHERSHAGAGRGRRSSGQHRES